jgi:hypothetical protein
MSQLLAKEIAALVPMDKLVNELGIVVNRRTRRARCLLHGGDNPTSLSWTEDGLWHCFSCRRGGDKIALVREARGCGFRAAVAFLGALAGVGLADDLSVRDQLRRRRRERQRLAAAAKRLLALERTALLAARDELHSLADLRRTAGNRLAELEAGAPERWAGEGKIAWEALRLVADQEAGAAAAYYVAAFSSPAERARFALRPAERQEMVRSALGAGLVADGKGHVVEIVL